MIRFDRVSFSYKLRNDREIEVLCDLDLEVHSGEFVVILGRNDSGKTTLAKLMAGLLLPANGSVYIEDRLTEDLRKENELCQLVGIVFSNPENQSVSAVVEEDIAFGLENLGIESTEISRRVSESLKMVGLESYVHYPPHLLSGGQQQLIAIAGILAMRPKYIVLDESTSLLDCRGRDKVFKIIKRLNQEENIGIIYFTHSLGKMIDADRIFALNNGKIEAVDACQEISVKQRG